MRNHPDYLPEFSFIIEVDGKIIGSIFYTRSKILTPEGAEIPTLTFGPVSIHPDYHRMGFGRKLISYSIAEAKKHGEIAILTLGYPYHYEPYGFRGGKNHGVSMPDGNFYKGLLVLPLAENTRVNMNGHAIFSDVFELDQEAVEAFDATFPAKEKCVQASQAKFAEASIALDN